MRILHINTTDTIGGAARGCYWLHQALRGADVDSHLLVLKKASNDSTVHSLTPPAGRLYAQHVIPRLESRFNRHMTTDEAGFWSLNLLPNTVAQTIDRLSPDIVHLHWVGMGMVPIQAVAQIDRPLVWTLRDMWPFTGGCHYARDCRKYTSSCGDCPQLVGERTYDWSRAVWHWKCSRWRNKPMHLVALSTWLAGCARQSSLFEDVPITVIPNGVFTDRFEPLDKQACRRDLSLPADKRLVLFGSLHPQQDTRKGYQHLLEALFHLSHYRVADDTAVAIFGSKMSLPTGGNLPVYDLGYIDDDQTLAKVYSAADVMVVPSLQEAFGKTVIEAMACATPVVAFDTGGPTDVISHHHDGYLAPPGDATELAAGMAWCIENPHRQKEMSRCAVEKVRTTYDIEHIAERYCRLYEDIIA